MTNNLNSDDRALELLETKTPHQMAVEMVAMQDRCDVVSGELAGTIRECEAMAELLRDLRPDIELHLNNSTVMKSDKGIDRCNKRLQRIDALLAGQVPDHTEQPLAMVPEGWQLVPVEATRAMIDAAALVEEDGYAAMHSAMLAAAPKPVGKGEV